MAISDGPEPAAGRPAEALRALGPIGARRDTVAALLAAAPDGCPARVTRIDRDRVAVTDGRSQWRTDPERSFVEDPDTGEWGLPAVGDWVAITPTDSPTILALGPRHGRLVRRDPGEPRPQILASNVDVVVITVSCDRDVNIARLERELVTAFDASTVPVIAMTKADLIADIDGRAASLRPASRDLELIPVSAHDPADQGVRRIRDVVRRMGTGALLGPSGTGKSTLINAMVGTDDRATGDVRAGDRKGRHVTATRTLVPLPDGGALIDTPGLRALGLWDADEGLARTFAEITDAADGCRFLDCTHHAEPGCAVIAAARDGRIDGGRLERYRTLYRELVEVDEEREIAERHRRRRADRRQPR